VTSPADKWIYAVDNVTRGRNLAGRVELARTSAARRRGLLGVEELASDRGLWIKPCEAIHTFGMKIPLDAVFIGRDFQIRKILTNLAPRRLGVCFLADSVLELRAGTILRTGAQCGDKLRFRRLTAAEV
jgi:hypothetical protein